MQNKSSLSTPPFSYILSPRHLQDSSIIFHQHILPNNYYFYYTDDMDFAYLAKDDTYVLIYGLCIDIQNNTLQNKEICSILSDSLLNGKERFYDAIDMLSGRFIIIYGYNKEYFILSDACGMLKITYDYENKAISNNIFLIDDYFRNKKREYRDNFNTKSFHQGCLGNLQPLKGMKILTPNHELDLNSFSINRFYPRKPIAPSSDTEAVSNRICHYIQVQEKLLSSQYHLLYSLTAGLDSRFTISSINRNTLADNSYFVYAVDDAHMNDLHIACYLADKLNIDLYCLINSKYKDAHCIKQHILENVQDTKFINDITPWLWYNSGRRLLPYYIEMLKKIQKNTLFIRSNLYEIGRAYWKNECHDINMILKLSKKEAQYTKQEQEIFVEYFKETALTPEGICNQNLLDYFYWEHRMGTWICEVLQETDFVFNTHSYCNCRKILELFLSVDYESRKKASVFWSVIKNNEAISDIPINPRNYKLPATQVKQEKNTYPRKELSFHQLGAENFSPEVPTIYAIEWDGVTYELLIHRQPKSGQAVVWGNGAVDKTKHSLPIFQRHSWGNSQAFNGIWYFDPTLYRGESSLYWCYGTNDRWYLKDIAYLVYFILNTWNISMKQVLYFGSSGGGFTSMMLAVLLRGKALAINPQFDCRRYYNSTYLNLLKEHVLDTSEELITARISVVECIRKEKYFPSIHVVENLLSKRDMKDQLIFFLEEISSCDEEGPLRITFYRNTNGHNGLPSKEQCIELIKQDMPTPELPPEWIRRIAKKS